MLSLISLVLPAAAQIADSTIPENASPKSYGGGWACDAGFRETRGVCETIVAPANAFLNDKGFWAGMGVFARVPDGRWSLSGDFCSRECLSQSRWSAMGM